MTPLSSLRQSCWPHWVDWLFKATVLLVGTPEPRPWLSVVPLRPRPDDNALLRKRTRIALFWPIVHTDPENALFGQRVSGWRNPKTQPSHSHVDGESAYFPKRWRHHPTPPPLASDLWTQRRLIRTTTTMADYMLVFVPQKILSLSCNLLASGFLALFFLLCLVSPSTVYLFTARKLNAHAPCLLRFWLMSSVTFRLEYELQRFRSFSVDPYGRKYSWNNAKEDGEKKDCFRPSGRPLRALMVQPQGHNLKPGQMVLWDHSNRDCQGIDSWDMRHLSLILKL